MTTLGEKAPVGPGLPLVGSMFAMMTNLPRAAYRTWKARGDVVRVIAGPPGARFNLYLIASASGLQAMHADTSSIRKDCPIYNELRDSLGNGLLTRQDETHARQHRILQPLFSNRNVDSYADLMVDEVTRTMHEWDEVVDVHRAGSDIAVRVVSRALIGNDRAELDDVMDVIKTEFAVASKYVLKRGMTPVRTPRSWPTPGNRRARAATEKGRQVCEEIIRRRLSRPDTGSLDMLSLLTRARDESGQPLSVEEIGDHLLAFVAAGKEALGTGLAFTLHEIAKHPEIQEKCRAEVMAQIGGRRPLPSDIIRLPYLTMVVKECLRLHPPVPWSSRKAAADVVIDGYRVPAGSLLGPCQWLAHRHPDYWPDPERFDPERFAPEREIERPRYAYLPFGGGARACIGQYFSMLQLVLTTALVLRGYRLEAIDQKVRIDFGITLVAKSPMRCRVTPMRG